MKKFLLSVCGLAFFYQSQAQCVAACSNYTVMPISYSLFPTGNTMSPLSFSVSPFSSFNPSGVNPDDGVSPLIPIGFNFDYYCTTYTDVWICTNGFIQFNNGTPAIATGYADPVQSFPSQTAPNAMVALNQTDMDYTTYGSISYTTVGTAPNRTFIVTYDGVPGYFFSFPTNFNTGQIVLYETSNVIEIHSYSVATLNDSYATSTQGIENASGTMGTAVPGRNNTSWTAVNDAWRFIPVPPAPAPVAIGGPTILCVGTPATYTIDALATPNATAYNWTTPGSWTGTTGNGTDIISTTVNGSGLLSVTATYTAPSPYNCVTSLPLTLNVTAAAAPVVNIWSVYPSAVCSGGSATMSVGGAADYTLEPGGITFSASSYTFIPDATTAYSLTGTSSYGCLSSNTAVKLVTVKPTPTISANTGKICAGESFSLSPSGGGIYVYSQGGAEVVSPPEGVYDYTVNSTVDGCAGIPAVCQLTVLSMPKTSAAVSSNEVCRTETVSLTVNGADDYLWSSGATASLITVSFTNTPPGTVVYTVTGTNTGGCEKTATVAVQVFACVGVNELQGKSIEWIVYPNPSKGEFTVKTEKEMTVLIYDIQGKVVLKQEVKSGENVINLNAQSSGQYLMKAVSEERQQSIILIKE
ncbi:MAG: T9SS type A sorting domain-containing protein [Bacteroidetes bacterium]|nr:T9SS type A sorting domain-containing protein [Bacteroidota bacterium]